MEEIKSRLAAVSDSPYTDSLAILSTLNPIAEELFNSDPSNAKKISEILTTALGSSNPILSSTVIEILSRKRVDSDEHVGNFIQEFLYQLPRVAYPGTLVSAIGRLGPTNISSTYLSILRHCPSSWPWVLDEISKSDFNSFSSLFAQVLLDPSPSLHLTSFRVALREYLLQKNEEQSQFFILDSLQWLLPSPENRFWIYEIISKKLSPEERLGMYSSLTIDRVVSGMDPSDLLAKIRNEIKIFKGPDSVLCSVIIILTEAFDRAFFGHYLDFFNVFSDLFDAVKNKYVLGIFVCSLLGVTLVPSKLLPQEVWNLGSSLINKYYDAVSKRTSGVVTNILTWNREVNLSYIKIRLLNDISTSNDSVCEWLKRLQDTKCTLDHLSIVKTIFLESSSPSLLESSVKILSKILSEYPQRSHGVLAIILHKLSKEVNPKALNVILKSLSIVVKDKNCIKFVVKIVNSLSNSSHLAPIKLKLLFDLYKVEDRTYPYLHKALEDKYTTDDAVIAKAFIIYKICSKKSSKHASDLLPLLSDILNGQGHEYASILSLKAIYAMANDSVIDVETTLKALQPKIMADGFVDVKVALLQICALVTEFEVESDKFEAFSLQTLKFLWSCTKKCQENSQPLRKAAFESIGKYGFYKQRFELLPNYLTNGFKPIELVENEIATLYVPGEVWVKALLDSSEEDLTLYEDLLKDFLKDEVKEFPPSVYYLQHKKNEKARMNYDQVLSESSVLRYLIQSLTSQASLPTYVVSSIFRILSTDYLQQFPPLNWDFMVSFPKKYEVEIVYIIIHQIRKSDSARAYLEKILSRECSLELIIAIFNKLDFILQYYNTPVLNEFLKNISEIVIDKTPLISLLRIIKDKAKLCVQYDEFIRFFKSLYDQVACDDQLFEVYLEVIPYLPHEYWSQFSNPMLLDKITEPLLKNSYKTRRILSRSDNFSLIWYNDCIEALTLDSVQFDPLSIHEMLLSGFIEARIYSEANRRWIMDFMGLILGFVRRKKNSQFFPLLFDIFVEALYVFSGLETWMHAPIDGITSSSNKCQDFLSSIIQFCLLSGEKAWNSFGIQLGEWLVSLLRDERISEENKKWIRASLSSFKYGCDFDQICIKLVQHFYELK